MTENRPRARSNRGTRLRRSETIQVEPSALARSSAGEWRAGRTYQPHREPVLLWRGETTPRLLGSSLREPPSLRWSHLARSVRMLLSGAWFHGSHRRCQLAQVAARSRAEGRPEWSPDVL